METNLPLDDLEDQYVKDDVKDQDVKDQDIKTDETDTTDQKIEGLNKTLSKVMSNFDRVNTELQGLKKERDELLKEKMTATEKAQFELDEQKRELDRQKAALEQERLKNIKLKLMSENKIDSRFEDYISGNDESELKLSIINIVKIIDEEVTKRVNERLTTNKLPESGSNNNGNSNDISKQFNDALKSGNFALATKLAGQLPEK